MKKEYLKHFLPFLANEYRTLLKNELNSEKVFKEFFPGEKIDFSKLEAIFEYQKNEVQKSK